MPQALYEWQHDLSPLLTNVRLQTITIASSYFAPYIILTPIDHRGRYYFIRQRTAILYARESLALSC
ncbi:unnamed protein product (plasmid) [Mycetohabitans rhizoxinica HKI 454]|uniref:Uncharacterized protein n=1 Tax=Mycetohabitans rhizoxinica (strain DSM 19002 / CIP 109453 / HKI 454) TaxID=882378 RepID=E5ATN6_MYCRK|nr:unnamed protein product [Mycetohabitans rhizoxinica HKI 454]